MNFLSNYPVGNWVLLLAASFIIGLSKDGLKGIDMLSITIMAIVFSGKASTRIVLPPHYLAASELWITITNMPNRNTSGS